MAATPSLDIQLLSRTSSAAPSEAPSEDVVWEVDPPVEGDAAPRGAATPQKQGAASESLLRRSGIYGARTALLYSAVYVGACVGTCPVCWKNIFCPLFSAHWRPRWALLPTAYVLASL